MRVGLVTCARLPEPDPDEALLLEALRATGVGAEMVAWDAAGPDGFGLLVLRSAWNYYEDPEAFLAWTARAPRLLNPAPVVRWNAHKRYLPSVARGGERALVWIDGALTHAVAKSPRFADEDELVSGALPIARDEAEFAHRVLGHVDVRALLYARGDVVRDDDGALRLSELELIEPSLFLLQSESALARFVAAIDACA